MRVAIVAPSPIPFGPGGAEALWSGLYRELADNSSHDVELIKMPIRETSLPEVMDAYRAFSTLDLAHFDLIISGKYPAWMVSHPRHVVYMLHPLRGLYDSYDSFALPSTERSNDPAIRRLISQAFTIKNHSDLPDFFDQWSDALTQLGPEHPTLRFPGPLARTLVHAMDRVALQSGAIARYFAISRTVAHRTEYFPIGAAVDVVYPPPNLKGLHEQTGEFFFTASRHDEPKRLDLLIAGMAHYPGRTRLLIGGRGPQSDRLEALAASDPRVEFVGRLSRAELVDHYSRAIGVPFIPFDEDLGLITIEAMTAGKPVLTTTDSGGPMEFVVHGVNGIVAGPNPYGIGLGLAQLEHLAASGISDRVRRTVKDISWHHVAAELLRTTGAPRPRSSSGRPRLVVTSTFPIWPPRGGGQLRAYNLYGALTERFDVDLICMADPRAPQSVRELRPGLVEYVIPRSKEHQAADEAISREIGFPATDIVAGRLVSQTPDYLLALTEATRGAHGVILADPFLHPALGLIGSRLPVVYDAYNCELILKSQMLPRTPAGDELLDVVREVEGRACAEAKLVLAVSDEDREHLRDFYGTSDEDFLLVPNGVDLANVPFTQFEQRQANRAAWLANLAARGRPVNLTSLATFVGSWHLPNNEAGRAVVSMAPELPHIGFLLMGSHCATLQHLPIPPNVFLLGIVSDAVKKTVLGSVDLALAPLLTGSGTNLKVVEYLAAGAPVVSTAVGLRGLRIGPGIARLATIEGFPSAIEAELADTDVVADRTIRGRRAIEATLDWSAIGRMLIPHLIERLDLPAGPTNTKVPTIGSNELWPGRRRPPSWISR